MNRQNFLREVEAVVSEAGHTVPLQRRAFNRGFSFDHFNFEDQLEIWDFIFNDTELHNVEMFCIYFLEKHLKDRGHMHIIWPVIKHWQDKIQRWESSDAIAKIYAQLVEYDPQLVLPTLQMWNISSNAWHRRQSIVGLIYYASQRNHYLPFKTMIKLVFPLLGDKAHYVQRAVGWTLKEIWKIYPEEQEAFVFAHADKISAIGYSAGTEKWLKAKREKLKSVRKAARIKDRP